MSLKKINFENIKVNSYYDTYYLFLDEHNEFICLPNYSIWGFHPDELEICWDQPYTLLNMYDYYEKPEDQLWVLITGINNRNDMKIFPVPKDWYLNKIVYQPLDYTFTPMNVQDLTIKVNELWNDLDMTYHSKLNDDMNNSTILYHEPTNYCVPVERHNMHKAVQKGYFDNSTYMKMYKWFLKQNIYMYFPFKRAGPDMFKLIFSFILGDYYVHEYNYENDRRKIIKKKYFLIEDEDEKDKLKDEYRLLKEKLSRDTIYR